MIRKIKNVGRQRRTTHPFFADLSHIVDQTHMIEQEMGQEGKFELGMSPLLKIILTLVIEHEIDYLTQGFTLELYAEYETGFIMRNLAYLYELQATNRES